MRQIEETSDGKLRSNWQDSGLEDDACLQHPRVSLRRKTGKVRGGLKQTHHS